jgi:Mg-chelatase subunit ChlD
VTGDVEIELKDFEEIEEHSGSLKSQLDDKLMHSVLENDTDTIEKGKLIKEAINQGISSFTPDLMFENLIRNYSLAENLYGKKLIRFISGYNADYVNRNIQIPEFRRELKTKIKDNIDSLKKDNLIDKEGHLKDQAIDLATIALYTEELENITPRGEFGEIFHKKTSHYGDKAAIQLYKRGSRYRDISIRKTIQTAIRRSHKELIPEDIRVHERQSRGKTYIVYALDASGSMRGAKIDSAKKAGVALAYKAIENKDNVGLIVFSKEVTSKIMPTNDFSNIIREITKIRSSSETNIVEMIKQAIDMFPNDNVTKHLIILSDALPTIGKDPEKETLQEAAKAREADITVSIVGINLDDRGTSLAKKIIEITQGRLYQVKNLEEVDKIVLEDYYSVV